MGEPGRSLLTAVWVRTIIEEWFWLSFGAHKMSSQPTGAMQDAGEPEGLKSGEGRWIEGTEGVLKAGSLIGDLRGPIVIFWVCNNRKTVVE